MHSFYHSVTASFLLGEERREERRERRKEEEREKGRGERKEGRKEGKLKRKLLTTRDQSMGSRGNVSIRTCK